MSIPQVQVDEIEALSSILADDFVPGQLVKKSAWAAGQTATQQPFFVITLRPDDDTFKHLDVWVKIEVRLPKRYPAIALILTCPTTVKEATSHHVTEAHLVALEKALRAKVSELAATGEEAMWEVYSCGAELLSRNNAVREQQQQEKKKQEKQRQSDMVLSFEEQKRQRDQEGAKAKEKELHLQQEAERKSTAEKASSLAKAMEEREQAIKAERARRRVGFQDEDQVDKESVQTAPRSPGFPRSDTIHLATPFEAALKSPPVPSPSMISTRTNLNILSFDPPLQLDGDQGVVRHFDISPALGPLRGLVSSHLAIPAQSSALPRLLSQLRITSPYFSTSRGRRKLAGLERELQALSQVRHSTIRSLEGFQLSRVEKHIAEGSIAGFTWDNADGESFLLSLVEAPSPPDAHESKLQSLLALQSLATSKMLQVAADLLSAVSHLHSRGLLLKDLPLERVCVRPQTTLIDSVWMGSVLELHRANPLQEQQEVQEPWSEGWATPELKSEARHTRKGDAFAVGRILLLCLLGPSAADFNDPWTALTAIEKSFDTDATFNLLSKLLERSPKRRILPADALAHLESTVDERTRAGKAGPIPDSRLGIGAPPAASTKSPATIRDTSPPASRQASQLSKAFFSSAQLQQPAGPSPSRFLSDFVPLSVLGKGAFGVVSKVKNRLDGGVYAVKKIRLDGGEEQGEEKTLREIGALARVNHPHVTRYYAAWIEEMHTEEAQADGFSDLATSATPTTSNEERTDGSTPTHKTQAHSFSLSFGPPKDSDFDDAARAEEEDFLSHVGFAADDESEAEDASTSSSDEIDSNDDDQSGSGDAFNQNGLVATQRAMRSRGSGKSKSHAVSRAASQSSQRRSMSRPSVAPRKPRWLYIQMELVDDLTLREVIERGPMSMDDCWRFLRQILNALVHIHNLGIVHRDLKPSNILMSGADIKIGDFGLATTLETVPTAAAGGEASLSNSGFLPPLPQDSSGRALIDSEDMTGEVGTALYAAPEIVKQRGARYGYKVDMYSLGIIVFEMVASGRIYSTGMERVLRLRALRQPSVEFPPSWPTTLSKERDVVKWLCTHSPEERPSPLGLLQSELLPPRLEDESVQETLRLVTDPSSVYHLQLLDSLFASKPSRDEEIRDATFDAGSQRETLADPREAVVMDWLRTVFVRRGAIELTPPLLMPSKSGLYSSKDGGNPVSLLDSTGQVVHLPRDHLVPFARAVARAQYPRLKRYCIGPVYRESLLAGGQPMAIMAANLDIVTGADIPMPPAAEGECLACLEEVLSEVPGFKNDWVILVNHGVILDLLLERVPVNQQASTLAALMTLSSRAGPASSSHAARTKLTQQLHLPKSIVDELELCASMCEDVETVHAKLDRVMPVDHRPTLSRAVQAIIEVREAARKLGVPAERRFLLSPMLSNHSQYFKGQVFFQVARPTGGKKRRGRWDVVASGGRYSSLIARFATPLSGNPPNGVGIQIAVSKLVHALAKDQEISEPRRPPDLWTPRRADVYVHSAPGMLDTRMEVTRELWANGVRADVSYEDDAGQESMLMVAARCKEEGFSFLVYAARSIKVRSLWTKMADVEFQSTLDLMPWLLEHLARLLGGGAGGTYDALAAAEPQLQSGGVGQAGGVGTGASGQAGMGGAATSGVSNAALALGGEGGGSSATGTSLSANTGSLAGGSAMMETQVVLPVHASTRQKDKSDRGANADRRVKLSTNHPVIHSATREAHRLAGAISSGEIPVIAVDLRGDAFDGLCSAAMAKDTARRDVAWRGFFDTLSSGEEREYAKNIRSHIERSTSGGSAGGQVMLFSIREKRSAIVGTTPAGR
ncbi:hypothetical protein BDZ90DRAFT_229240 [Jaminaea rosea]|uniref:non-specific serine/threonine protein kinase n=1 Tax=Jaminaea rosea TaxID=1569628 RepID=A0A316UYD1_9BASI|nr:hypothetical protein BDZ90DRAFT_229240 [Jaminaea rosea]PWN30222.1 hypothetical protein BDZ90DRAFT_229240 [Jaminaea rosea]